MTLPQKNGQVTIIAGQIDAAQPCQLHGAINEGSEGVVFLFIYSVPKLQVVPASP